MKSYSFQSSKYLAEKICFHCGATEQIQMAHDPVSESDQWVCENCLKRRFPKGTRVVKFTDKAFPSQPAYHLPLRSEMDLELILTLGDRAQRMGAEGFEACFYTSQKETGRFAPISFDLGQSGSSIQFRGYVDKLRLQLETSKTFAQVGSLRDEFKQYIARRKMIHEI